VLVGYLHGVAVVLVCGQLGKLFGVPIAAEDPLPQLKEFFSELDQIHGLTVLVGALSIGVLLLLKWKMPKIPAALLVVAAAGLLVRAPLARVPENAIKFAVGVMIVSFGTFWTLEALASPNVWPGGDWSLIGLVIFYGVGGLILAALLRRSAQWGEVR